MFSDGPEGSAGAIPRAAVGSQGFAEGGIAGWRLLSGRLPGRVRSQGLHRQGGTAVRVPGKEKSQRQPHSRSRRTRKGRRIARRASGGSELRRAALKACIAKEAQRYESRKKRRVTASHTHDLGELVKVAELQDELLAAAKGDPLFRKYWNDVQEWSEQSRYDKHSEQSARALIEAIGDRNHGVMKWVKLYW